MDLYNNASASPRHLGSSPPGGGGAKAKGGGRRSGSGKKWAGIDLGAPATGAFPPLYVNWQGSHHWQGRDALFYPPAGFVEPPLTQTEIKSVEDFGKVKHHQDHHHHHHHHLNHHLRTGASTTKRRRRI